jgi:uncharacterized RDD family membrane protein YckC
MTDALRSDARSSAPANASPALRTAGLRRRMASFVYEGVLLFGVVMLAGFIYGNLTQQQHALQGTLGLQVTVFIALGLYFVGFWTLQGQTLAMKTWHIRLVDAGGGTPSRARALARYVASWIWFVPWLGAYRLLGWQGGWSLTAMLFGGVMLYALLSRLHPQRQFWHDHLCGTRLIDTRQAEPATPLT